MIPTTIRERRIPLGIRRGTHRGLSERSAVAGLGLLRLQGMGIPVRIKRG